LAVRRIGEGDLEARARIQGEDEIAQVGRELDTMADKLREYRSSSLGELLQAQQASQAAIDSLPDPILVVAADGTLLNVNESAERELQIQAGERPLTRIDPDLRDAIEKVRAHVVAGKGPYLPRGLEEALHVRDRRLLPRATPLYSEEGAVAGATIVLQDVTRLVRFDELKNDLVATAVRHSGPGSTVVVRAQPQHDSVRVEVEDHGEGIPAEYRSRIFAKFFRVPGTKGEGIGLGLYLAREIVLAHGGDMGVESEP